MTRTRAGFLGLATATTGVALLVRMFVHALQEIDVEITLDPYGHGRSTSARRA